VLRQYLQAQFTKKLTKEETLILVKMQLLPNKEGIKTDPKNLLWVRASLYAGLITPSQELGDFIYQYNISMATDIYIACQVYDKILICFIKLKDWEHAVTIFAPEIYGVVLDFPAMIATVYRENNIDGVRFALKLLTRPKADPNRLSSRKICEAVDILGEEWELEKLLKAKLAYLESKLPSS